MGVRERERVWDVMAQLVTFFFFFFFFCRTRKGRGEAFQTFMAEMPESATFCFHLLSERCNL